MRNNDRGSRKPPEEDELEIIKEKEVLPLISKLRSNEVDDVFLRNYPLEWIVSNKLCIFKDISWSEMKKHYKWGFSGGQAIANFIDWIYIRPDVANGLDSDIIGGISGLVKKGTIGKHYFLVKTKAIKYFLSKCVTIIDRPRQSVSYSSDEEDEIERQVEKENRNKLSKYFSDEAAVDKKN